MTMALVPKATTDAIDACCARLAVAFQRQIDAATIKVYREALSDIPVWAIERAALVLARTGGTFFPTTARWHEVAEAVMEANRRDLLMHSSHAGPECETCRDTGWADEEKEGRSYVVPCSCRSRNTNYQRMTASSRKSSGDERP